MNPKLTKVLAGLVLFASGAVTGFFGARLVADRGALALLRGTPEHFVEVTVHRLSRDLDLSPEQLDKLRPIVLDTAKKLAAIRAEQEPKIHEIVEKSIAATKPLLTKEQLAKFEAIQARLKARREAMERLGRPPHWGPPPPPPGFDGGPPPPGFDGGPPPPPPDFDGPPPPGMEDLLPPPHEGRHGGPRGPHGPFGPRPPRHDDRDMDRMQPEEPAVTPGTSDTPRQPEKPAPAAPETPGKS